LFEIGQVYRRRWLHETYGGNPQSGISPLANHPAILVFTGESGRQHGYLDRWEDDGTFRYYGEGQVGDMKFERGNTALRDHTAAGRDVHLFESRTTPPHHVRYEGPMVCAGFEYEENVPDRNGTPRRAIVFHLVPASPEAAEPPLSAVNRPEVAEADVVTPRWYWTEPLESVRTAASARPTEPQPSRQARRTVYHRAEAVRVYVLRRADGRCEGCGASAPFQTPDGRPYLEPHHTRRLSDGGPDHPVWVIAVCPTCHRRAHYAADAMAYNAHLQTIVAGLERPAGQRLTSTKVSR
jgi:5-methylcytosine-specific restriction enzyme A